MLKLKPRPGTYSLIFSSPGEATVQVGKLGEIQLREGWYVYVGSALAAKTGVLRRVARHADSTRPKKWNVDYVKPHLQLLEIWFTHDPARRECVWSATVGSLPGAEVHLQEFGGRDCRAGCPAHFYYFRDRPTLARFEASLVQRLPEHGAVGYLQSANPEGLTSQLGVLVREIESVRNRRGRRAVTTTRF